MRYSQRLFILGLVMIFSAGAVAIMLMLAQVRPVRAGIVCVKPDGEDGCMSSIHDALMMAAVGDVIKVAPGTYVENVVISKTITLEGGWAPDFSHRDLEAYIATILPSDDHQSVVSILGQFGDTNAVAPTLDGFVITGGRADLGSNHGGGLRIVDSNARVISNTIKNNVAFLLGGVVWVQRGAPVLQGNQIMDNQTVGNGQDAHGGGLQLENTQAMLLDNLIASNMISGTQTYGGGVEVSGSSTGQVILQRNRFISNTASIGSTGFGGAIAVASGRVMVNDSLVFSNTAVTGGGGFWIGATGAISLTNSAAIANLAGGDGGAILNTGVISVSNVTISGNTATGMGGGIANTNLVNIRNATIAENTSPQGAGLSNSGTLNALNSLIALNQGVNCLGVVNSQGHNLEDGGTCVLGQPSDMSNTDPYLGSLGNNHGQTPTHALADESPAIDAGDNAACSSFDQRGVKRPIDGDGDGQAVCDIGAYEFQIPLYLPVILQD